MENTEDPEEKERKERYKVMAKFVTLRTKRVYGGGEVQLLLFLTWVLDGGECLASSSGRLASGETVFFTH